MRYEIGSVHPSILTAFSWNDMYDCFFSKFWHGARNPYEVVHDTAGFFLKKFFAPEIGKADQKWAKNRIFLNLSKNLVINFH